MRITNSMLIQSALQGMRDRLGDLTRAQTRATTLRRIHAMSDDPVAAAEVSRIDSTLRDVEQFRRNVSAARTRLSAEDVVLTSMRTLLQQARQIAMSVAQLSAVDPQRQSALGELQNIQNQLVSLGNTKVGEDYLLGGGRTSSPPFLPDGTYVGDSTVRQAQIDEGVYVDTVHAGDHSIGGAMLSLTTLEQSVATETAPEIVASAAAMQSYEQQLLSDQAEVGARLQTVTGAETRLAMRANGAVDRRDELSSVDPAQAAVEVQAAQTALERAYAVVGRVLQTNLLDFLK
jgi:flagellar hook-associated protein 3 FlgL